MNIKKIKITKEHIGYKIKDILLEFEISPEVVLVKIDNEFIPISEKIKKETELEVLEVIKH